MENLLFCTNRNKTFHGQAHYNHHELQGGERFLRGREGTCAQVRICSRRARSHSLASRAEREDHQLGESRCSFVNVMLFWQTINAPWNRKTVDEKTRRASECQIPFFVIENFVMTNWELLLKLAVAQDTEGEGRSFPQESVQLATDITKESCDYLPSPGYEGCFIIATTFE